MTKFSKICVIPDEHRGVCMTSEHLSLFTQNFPETNIRAITLWQPWASLIPLGLKRYETRSWATSYRGKLLIHAAARPMKFGETTALLDDFAKIGMEQECREVFEALSDPEWYGSVVAIADLTNCLLMESHPRIGTHYLTLHAQGRADAIIIETVSKIERTVGNWESGRYAWKLENIAELPIPIPCKGKQGLWIPSREILEVL